MTHVELEKPNRESGIYDASMGRAQDMTYLTVHARIWKGACTKA